MCIPAPSQRSCVQPAAGFWGALSAGGKHTKQHPRGAHRGRELWPWSSSRGRGSGIGDTDDAEGQVWFGSGAAGEPPATLEERPAGSEGMGPSCRVAGYTEEEPSKGPEAQWVPKNGLAPEEVLRNQGGIFDDFEMNLKYCFDFL